MSTVAETDASLETGLHLLEAGIPLTLLLDLAAGPDSHDLYVHEPADGSWLQPRSTSEHRLAG